MLENWKTNLKINKFKKLIDKNYYQKQWPCENFWPWPQVYETTTLSSESIEHQMLDLPFWNAHIRGRYCK